MAGMTTMISCKGEEGDPGPAGVAGRNGTDGTDGTNGNANVQSVNLTITSQEWQWSGPETNFINLPVPILTSDICNKGSVMVYSSFNGTFFTAWPWTDILYGQSFIFQFQPGALLLLCQSTNNDPYGGNLFVRVVAASAEGLASNPNLDWTNYEAVKEALNLAD